MNLIILSPVEARERWQDILSWIETSLDQSPDIKIADVEKLVFTNGCTVVVCEEDNKWTGALVIVFKDQPEGRIAWLIAMGGRWICTEEGIGLLKEKLAYTKSKYMRGIARPSVARMWSQLGVRSLYTVMEMDL
jgi:hypothetical protein